MGDVLSQKLLALCVCVCCGWGGGGGSVWGPVIEGVGGKCDQGMMDAAVTFHYSWTDSIKLSLLFSVLDFFLY